MNPRTRPAGWLLDNSVAARLTEPEVAQAVGVIREPLAICPIGRLEQLYSATSGADYDGRADAIADEFFFLDPPDDVFGAVLDLQRDLAHHHGMWHRIPLGDLLIAVTALAHNYGVLHHDADYERITKVRPLIQRRVG